MEPPERIPRQVRHNPGAEIAKGNARGTAGGTKLHHRLILPGTTPGKGKLPDEQKTTQPPHLAQDCAELKPEMGTSRIARKELR